VRIFAIHRAHDGATACIEDGRLISSIEAEKDSGPRYAPLAEDQLLRNLANGGRLPDVLAHAGWAEEYWGLEALARSELLFFKKIGYWRTTHERAHILCSYGLSPFSQGQPCYVLVWEGSIGCFYRVDPTLNIVSLGAPLLHPGHRYQTLWALAHVDNNGWYEDRARAAPERAIGAFQRILDHIKEYPDGPGKMMALAAFADTSSDDDPEVSRLIDFLVSMEIGPALMHSPQERLPTVLGLLERWEPFRHAHVQDQIFKNIVQRFSAATYEVFHRFAKANLREQLPLLISGGCGLNCTWNTSWRECGLFPETFVPPCTNDSGIAIGAGIDAQHGFTGNAKVEWSVMAGEEFVLDTDLGAQPDFVRRELDYDRLAHLLAGNAIVAWVQGRYEIGPRALGHRSLLAAPFESSMLTRLNALKRRESYRPIAPICLEEDVGEHFHWTGPSPYMLYFQKLKNDRLRAVTHVDGTARAQTVSEREDGRMHRLLHAFKKRTGVGVLCNTSLNFKGKGFINRSSDLLRFAHTEDVDVLVVKDEMLIRRAVFDRCM
jgi:predicted NodU family carbamoyl transferase